MVLNGNSATNGATVTNFDLLGSNGVAHTIDRVMAVPSVANVLATFSPAITINYGTNPPTINGGTANSDGTDSGFDLLAALIRYTGQVPVILPNATPLPDFTIFRANDGLIRAYLQTLNGTLVTETQCYTYISTLTAASVTSPTLAELTAFTQYHLVPGRFLSQDLTDLMVLTTLKPSGTITVGVAPGPPAIYTLGDANTGFADPVISAPNTLTNSGVVHTINAVLRPN